MQIPANVYNFSTEEIGRFHSFCMPRFVSSNITYFLHKRPLFFVKANLQTNRLKAQGTVALIPTVW